MLRATGHHLLLLIFFQKHTSTSSLDLQMSHAFPEVGAVETLQELLCAFAPRFMVGKVGNQVRFLKL